MEWGDREVYRMVCRVRFVAWPVVVLLLMVGCGRSSDGPDVVSGPVDMTVVDGDTVVRHLYELFSCKHCMLLC